MIRFILDSDTLSLFQRKHPTVTASIVAHQSATAISAISVEEQFGGWFARLRQSRSNEEYAAVSGYLSAAIEMLARFRVVTMTVPALDRFEQLKKSKLNVAGNDLRIAAIALESGATVVTRNLRDFGRVPGLMVVDWSV